MIISTFVRDIVLTKDDIGYTVKITYNYNENPSNSLDNSVQKGSQKSSLVEQRQQLADKIVAMQAVLERLDMKIDGYEERCLKFEEENLRQ